MDGFDVGDFGGANDCWNIEVTLGRARRPDADSLIGKADRERIAVGLAVDCDGLDAQLLAGADYAQCNFSAIGNQDLVEHSRDLRIQNVSADEY